MISQGPSQTTHCKTSLPGGCEPPTVCILSWQQAGEGGAAPHPVRSAAQPPVGRLPGPCTGQYTLAPESGSAWQATSHPLCILKGQGYLLSLTWKESVKSSLENHQNSLGRKYIRNTRQIKHVGFKDSLKDFCDICSYFIALLSYL